MNLLIDKITVMMIKLKQTQPMLKLIIKKIFDFSLLNKKSAAIKTRDGGNYASAKYNVKIMI